jgi:hypothetical protein
MGVFDAVEGEEEAAAAVGSGGEEVFEGEEGALAEVGYDALVGLGLGGAVELVAGFDRDADTGGAGEGGEALELGVATLPGDGDAVDAAGAGANGFFDRVKPVENFHR